MSKMAESSSQAIERYLAEQLAGLKLDVPAEEVEFMARFVEEEGLEVSEKVEGVRGMLEGVIETLPDGVDPILTDVVQEWDRIQARAEAEAADEPSPSPSPEPEPTVQLTDKEIAKLHAMRYAYADVDPAELAAALAADRGDAPPKGNSAADAAARKAAEERRALLEAAIRLDGKKKKHKKAQEVDLMAPNLNRDKVQYKAQLERDTAKKAAQAVKDRDKAALDKQRADAAKAKADKQKKAQKQERRG